MVLAELESRSEEHSKAGRFDDVSRLVAVLFGSKNMHAKTRQTGLLEVSGISCHLKIHQPNIPNHVDDVS